MGVMSVDQDKCIFLGLVLMFSLISVPLFLDANAQSTVIGVKSTSFAKTTIIEFENISSDGIGEIRLWLPKGIELESFKSENGWTGKKNSVGVLILNTSEALEQGKFVKFGIKTDRAGAKINWKAIDISGNQVGIGVSQPGDLEPPVPIILPNTDDTGTDDTGTGTDDTGTGTDDTGTGTDDTGTKVDDATIFDGISTLNVIPEKPRVASNIRVVGMSYASEGILNLYIDGKRIKAFETDSNGNFIITSKVPDNIDPGRIDFCGQRLGGKRKSELA